MYNADIIKPLLPKKKKLNSEEKLCRKCSANVYPPKDLEKISSSKGSTERSTKDTAKKRLKPQLSASSSLKRRKAFKNWQTETEIGRRLGQVNEVIIVTNIMVIESHHYIR